MRALLILTHFIGVCLASAPSGIWDSFNLSPASRVVRPTSVFRQAGDVKNANGLLSSSGKSTLSGTNSSVSLDFGKEVNTAIISRRNTID